MLYLILSIVLINLVATIFLIFARNNQPRSVKSSGRRKIYVDTSALFDGRIIDIAKTGFIDDVNLIIPRGALFELQALADGKEALKRSRARRGLEIISELERMINIDTEIVDDRDALPEVDEELLRLAKKNNGAILTLDYNLIKVAEAETIQTLNINSLSLATRTNFTAGEKIILKITERGSGIGQGIGYTDDGIRVVVKGAKKLVGQEVSAEFEKFLETASGRIIFAKLIKPRDGKRN